MEGGVESMPTFLKESLQKDPRLLSKTPQEHVDKYTRTHAHTPRVHTHMRTRTNRNTNAHTHERTYPHTSTHTLVAGAHTGTALLA